MADGEITVLDPGDYGGLVITRSISINNDSGGEASITVPGGNTGIIVNGTSGAYVNLRGLTIQGVGFGTTVGLRFNTGFTLTMTNCVVRNHTSHGIDFRPNASSNLSVSNTLVADNGGSGIQVGGSSGSTVKVVLSRVEIYNNNGNGFTVSGPVGGSGATATINASVTDSVAANNGDTGFDALGSSLMVVRSVAANNSTGVASGPAGIVRISQSTLTGNRFSWSFNPNLLAQVASYGDNNINGNGDGDPAPPTIAKK